MDEDEFNKILDFLYAASTILVLSFFCSMLLNSQLVLDVLRGIGAILLVAWVGAIITWFFVR